MLRIILQSLLLTTLAAVLSGCIGPGYYAQSLKGHVEILAARQSVEKLIGAPSTPSALRAEMAAAGAIRQFASDALGLPDNASYRTYVDIGRDYVTLAVYAAPEFSLAPQLWCFPVFGCVPYRGYFSRDAALKTARGLKEDGLDVYISGITAYSTLGWSSDPLLSTMFDGDRTYLAGLVFHELAHQRVYVNGDTAFNEAFAVAVETTGVKKWLRAGGDPAGLERYRAGLRRSADFLTLVAETRGELARVYSRPASADEKRAGKAAAIERLRARHRKLRDGSWGGYRGYDGWIDGPINNAKLAAMSVYNDLVPDFLRLFELCSDDYERFYAAVARLGRLGKGERRQALAAVTGCG
ncbi:putative aminopeptidase [Hoeflea phototrophica DFL-43]|uniref:Putative aminopeptidase n=1 Tax=Hoeflea phototrophica (strain DSM 17068 / NCIMB 14078 / DFL-43) TaxID=411684 RepID=A9D365_HOEPD|nr:aminopeptidase [Hoeflea phototrophica]EDQ34347.1 putative aminopeptidase [Hoeflea phototrophica DFL-43]